LGYFVAKSGLATLDGIAVDNVLRGSDRARSLDGFRQSKVGVVERGEMGPQYWADVGRQQKSGKTVTGSACPKNVN
jgi:hypothetical protein